MKATFPYAGAALLLVLSLLGSCRNQAIAAFLVEGKPMLRTSATVESSARDFDFLVGTWQVLNRRLKARHVKSDDWDEFPGRCTMRTILGGAGNVDEIGFPTKGWSGVSMRFFSPQTKQWSIYWVNSRDGVVQPPVAGAFRDGVGEFFGDDLDEGKPVRVRYRWSRITKDTARWEQAFSLDGGKSWETNWVMDFARLR
jgi:hypothetical protein